MCKWSIKLEKAGAFPFFQHMTLRICPLSVKEILYIRRELGHKVESREVVPRRLFFAAPQRIAITLSPNYYKKMQRSTTRKNQEEHGPEVK